jgi:signal transduction histidine kinase
MIAVSAAPVGLLMLGPARAAQFHDPTLRAAVETAIALFALIGAWVLRRQFTHTRRTRDLLLVAAVSALGLLDLSAFTLPAALDLGGSTYPAAVTLVGKLAVAGMFALAAYTPAGWRAPRECRPLLVICLAGCTVLAIAETVGLLLWRHVFASVSEPSLASGHPTREPVVAALIAVAAVLFLLAARGFARSAKERDAGAGAMLAVAMVLLAAARISRLFSPWLDTESIGIWDAVRLLAFSFVFGAIMMRGVHVRHGLARAAAAAERRRLAGELHDGLAQDLAFIAACGPRIEQQLGGDHPVVSAARHALAVSRLQIADLSGPAATSCGAALEAAAGELGARFGTAISVDADVDDERLGIQDGRDQHLVRIAREAMANACSHGEASSVRVSLQRTVHGLRLRIVDDGGGIERAAASGLHDGFGLRTMRERAAAIGGYLTVGPGPAGGTEVEVLVP